MNFTAWRTYRSFPYGDHGKPYFVFASWDVHFSLSHTRGAALLAVHNEPIGADIECLRPVSGAMRTRFHAANDADFWRLWVQRESRWQARGNQRRRIAGQESAELTE